MTTVGALSFHAADAAGGLLFPSDYRFLSDKTGQQCDCADHDVKPRDGEVDIQNRDDDVAHAGHKPQDANRQEEEAEEDAEASGRSSPAEHDPDQTEQDVNDGMRPVGGEDAEDDLTVQAPDSFDEKERADHDGEDVAGFTHGFYSSLGFQETTLTQSRERWESIKEVFGRIAAFEVIDQVLDRHTRSDKARRAAHDLGIDFDDGTHFIRSTQSLSRGNRDGEGNLRSPASAIQILQHRRAPGGR